MSSPVNATTLLPLLPAVGKSVCERVQPGIIKFMAEVTRGFAWEHKTNGEFSDELVAMIQALECVGGGVILPCPVVALAGTATPGDTTLALSFNGSRMVAGYDWNLYQSITEGVFADPAIYTGVTAGSVVNQVVSGLTNDTEYFFKFTVQKPTCALYEVQISGTPKECAVLLLTLGVVSDAPGHVKLTLTGNLENTCAYTLYASNLPNQIGSVLQTGVVADSPCQINGRLALCLEHTPAFSGVPGSGATWTYTLKAQQKPACFEYELTQSVFVADQPLATPILSFSNLAFRWGAVNGANRYEVYRRAIGSCKHSDVFEFVTSTPDNHYDFNQANFPCTENLLAPYCLSKWEVKAIAYGNNGNASAFSNVAQTPATTKFFGICLG